MEMKINKLPAGTWRWLHMNHANVSEEADFTSCPVQIKCPEEIEQVTKDNLPSNAWETIQTGMGDDMSKLLKESETEELSFKSKADKKDAEPVSLSFEYHDGDRKGNIVNLYLEENSEMTVVMDYHSHIGSGTAAIQTRIVAEKNAKLKLIQIERLSDGYDCLNDIGAHCEENASVELIQLIIGGKNVWMGAQTRLYGKSSELKAAIGYQVAGEIVLT